MSGDRQRASVASWLRTFGAIAAVVAVIGALGGFNAAASARRSAAPGTVIDAGRLHWTVHDVTLTDRSLADYEIEPSLRVRVTVLNTADDTVLWLDQGTVELVLPDGSVLDDLNWRSATRSLAFQPGIPADAYTEVKVDPARLAGGVVVVRVYDEIPYQGGITTESWQVDADATDVSVEVRDDRAAR